MLLVDVSNRFRRAKSFLIVIVIVIVILLPVIAFQL
jgi:hypothetical protein